MILNGVIESVEAVRSPIMKEIKSLEVDLKIIEIGKVGDNLEVGFAYEATYGGDIGYLRMGGRILVAPPSKKDMRDVLDAWEKTKTTPIGFSQEVINAAYHMCTVNSVLATKIINLSPPMPPLRIDLTQGLENAKKTGRGKK